MRSPGASVAEIIAADRVRPRPELIADRPGAFGDDPIAVARYTDRAFYEAEKQMVWRRTWQMACREEHLAEVGDTYVYDVCDLSFLLVRAAVDRISGFWNFCRHRGRRLASEPGFADVLRCPFHGFAWDLDGHMALLPAAWDFPLGSADRLDLVPVQVATWGGFVFINPDLDAPPLADHLGEMVEHFAPWRFEDRYLEAHVAKRCAANWKVVQEAFMESFHVAATHPQQLVRIGDTNSQYDCFGNVNRSIHPSGVASPSVPYVPTQQEMLDAMIDVRLDEPSLVTVPDGETMRSFVARVGRDALRPTIGAAADAISDSELVDAIPYWVFPNLHPWAAYQRIVYRFRPDGDDHRRCLMEVMLLSPFVGARPRPAPCHVLDDDEPWASAPELGVTGRILDQDLFNLPQVQAGLQLAPVDGLALSSYQESRIRHFHHLLDRHLAGLR